jgi:hypothetical protein
MDKSCLREELTPTAQIKEIKYAKKSFSYVPIKHFYTWLDNHYPGWDFEVDPSSIHEAFGYISVAGKLTVKQVFTSSHDPHIHMSTGRVIKSYGSDEVINKKDGGGEQSFPYLKAAESDALKRCVVKLGGFNDVYFEVDAETESQTSKEITEDDITYYMETIAPKVTPLQAYKQIVALSRGIITINDLKARFDK